MTIPLHGHTHQPAIDQPITNYRDDPRWQELNSEYSELLKGNPQETMNRKIELAWQKRDIEKVYEQLEARTALVARILFDHPAGASLTSSQAEELAQTIALKLI